MEISKYPQTFELSSAINKHGNFFSNNDAGKDIFIKFHLRT